MAAFAVLSTHAGGARAQSAADTASARELFIEGSRLSAAGDWAHAQVEFERSLKLKRAPITLFSLGVVETHTGRLVEALGHLRAFLAEPSAPATKPYEAPATAAVAELEHRVGRCTLVVTPADAPDLSVSVDGELVPSAALSVPRVVNPGAHTVVAIARGFRSAPTPCNVGEGASATVQLKLDPAPIVESAVVAPVEERTTVPVSGPPNRTVPFTLIGAGGVVFVVGLAVGLAGVKQASSSPTRDGSTADAARTKGLAGDVLGGVGIAGVAVGAAILIVQTVRGPARQADKDPKTGLRATPRGVELAF